MVVWQIILIVRNDLIHERQSIMNPKIALVTGASSGIGKATVRRLLNLGYTVYAAARRLDAMQDIQSEGAYIVHLDLADSKSIKNCVGEVLSEHGQIDVLINNAGYGLYGAVEDVLMDEARRQFEVNLFGMAEIIQQVLPSMRAQRSGKIILVSSIGGKVWSLLGSWYQASKFAVEGFGDCLRNELRPFGIDVIIIEPGSIKTDWAKIASENLVKAAANSAYKKLIDIASVFYLETEQKMGAEADVVAQEIVKSVTAFKPKARYIAPTAAKVVVFLRWLLPDNIFDQVWAKFYKMPDKI
jgi:short-subunit dehydrogenase